MKNIYIAIPAYTGTVRVETAQALMASLIEIARRGWNVSVQYSAGDSMLPRLRNLFIADFLRHEQFTDLIFIDHDVQWENGAIVRLLSHDVDVVAGVYPRREDPIHFPYRPMPGAVRREDGLIDSEIVPGGFMRITRKCAQEMSDHFRATMTFDDSHIDIPAVALFDFAMRDGKYWGEDFVFCWRWREMGGKVWADTNLRLAHFGSKAFIGRLADTFEEKVSLRAIA